MTRRVVDGGEGGDDGARGRRVVGTTPRPSHIRGMLRNGGWLCLQT